MANSTITHATGAGTTEAQYLASAHHGLTVGDDVQGPGDNRKYIIATSDSTVKEKKLANATSAGNDLHTLIATAISTGYKHIQLASGTFTCNTVISATTGMTLEGVGGGGTILNYSAAGSTTHIINAFGSAGASTAVTVGVNAGSTSVTVSSVSGFASNDLFLLKSSAVWRSNILNQTQGELQWVGSVNTTTNVIGLRGLAYFADSYSSTDSAAVQKVTTVNDFAVKGIKFVGSSTGEQYGINIQYGVNCEVADCTFQYVRCWAIQSENSIGFKAHGNLFDQCNMAGNGYGVALAYAEQGADIYDNTGINCRHVITVGGSAAPGIPRWLKIHHNHCFDGLDTGSGIDTHHVGQFIDVTDNIVQGGNQGLTYSAYSGRISRNIISNCEEYGIYTEGNSVDSDNIEISNNLISKSGINGTSYGIYVNTTYTYVHDNKIIDTGYYGLAFNRKTYIYHNVFDNCNGTDILSFDSANCHGTTIKNNTFVYGASSISIDLQTTPSSCKIIDNEFVGAYGSPIFRSGSAAIIQRNIGYVTENSGTVTVSSGATSKVFSHGLSYTPAAGDIVLTPANSMGAATKFYIGTYTSTQATVTVDVDPGASTAIFAWKAIK